MRGRGPDSARCLVPRRLGGDDGGDDAPSVAPTAALYSRMTKSRSPISPVLRPRLSAAWAGTGVLAFAFAAAGGRIWAVCSRGIEQADGPRERR
jgi:hypothetical protein